jgi:hypothetical protein
MLEIWNERCVCEYATISVRYIFLFCLQWEREREKELKDMARNLKEVLKIKYKATAAIRLILKTSLLEQFKVTVQAKEKRRRGVKKE